MLGEFKSSRRAFLMLDARPRNGDLSPPAADALGKDGCDVVQSRGGRGRGIGVERGGGGGRIVRERGVVHGHILRERGTCIRAGVRLALGFAPDAGMGPASGAGRLPLNTRNGRGAAQGPNLTPRSPRRRVNQTRPSVRERGETFGPQPQRGDRNGDAMPRIRERPANRGLSGSATIPERYARWAKGPDR